MADFAAPLPLGAVARPAALGSNNSASKSQSSDSNSGGLFSRLTQSANPDWTFAIGQRTQQAAAAKSAAAPVAPPRPLDFNDAAPAQVTSTSVSSNTGNRGLFSLFGSRPAATATSASAAGVPAASKVAAPAPLPPPALGTAVAPPAPLGAAAASAITSKATAKNGASSSSSSGAGAFLHSGGTWGAFDNLPNLQPRRAPLPPPSLDMVLSDAPAPQPAMPVPAARAQAPLSQPHYRQQHQHVDPHPQTAPRGLQRSQQQQQQQQHEAPTIEAFSSRHMHDAPAPLSFTPPRSETPILKKDVQPLLPSALPATANKTNSKAVAETESKKVTATNVNFQLNSVSNDAPSDDDMSSLDVQMQNVFDDDDMTTVVSAGEGAANNNTASYYRDTASAPSAAVHWGNNNNNNNDNSSSLNTYDVSLNGVSLGNLMPSVGALSQFEEPRGAIRLNYTYNPATQPARPYSIAAHGGYPALTEDDHLQNLLASLIGQPQPQQQQQQQQQQQSTVSAPPSSTSRSIPNSASNRLAAAEGLNFVVPASTPSASSVPAQGWSAYTDATLNFFANATVGTQNFFSAPQPM